MVELDPSITLIGPRGPVTLLDAFEGRRQLIAYYFMWHKGRPAAEQCEGCTWVASQVRELSYIQSRDVTFAVLCQGPGRNEEAFRFLEIAYREHDFSLAYIKADFTVDKLRPDPRFQDLLRRMNFPQ